MTSNALSAVLSGMCQSSALGPFVREGRKAKQITKGLTEPGVREALHGFDDLWSELFPAEQAQIIQLLVERVEISTTGAAIMLRTERLSSLVQDLHHRGELVEAA